MQVINNDHVLHGRTAYVDDPALGYQRHLKRLWLATDVLVDRPRWFQRRGLQHWDDHRSVSAIKAVARPGA